MKRTLADVAGVHPGSPVRLVPGGAHAAVVGDVPAHEFSGEALAAKLNEMPSLEALARGHADVLARLVAEATVLPARLATVFSNDEHVRREMARRDASLADDFRRLAGLREWGVKVYVDPRRLRRTLARESAEETASPMVEPERRGAAYLAERQRDRALAARLRDEVRARTHDLHRSLGEIASDARLVAARADVGETRVGDLALNAAYLLPRERENELAEAVDRFARRFAELGFDARATGPWPPYNFVEDPPA